MGNLSCQLIKRRKSRQIYTNQALHSSSSDGSFHRHDTPQQRYSLPNLVITPSMISSTDRRKVPSQYGAQQGTISDRSLHRMFYGRNSVTPTIHEALRSDEEELYQFMDFPFLTSLSVIKWINCCKIMFILRGPSGSGKTTIVECLVDKFPDATVCSPDQFFMQLPGSLKWDRSQLDEAEVFCQNEAYRSMEFGKSPIIIDDFHVRCQDYRTYVDMSVKFDYLTIIVVPRTPWRFDANKLYKISPKSEPIWEIERSVNLFEAAIPLYFGWFLNDRDSDNILQLAISLLDEFVWFPEIRLELAAACDLSKFVSKEDLVDNWTIKTDRLHITTKFCGYGAAEESVNYSTSGVVLESLGQLFPIHIKGLLLTPRTFSCHIQLAGPKQIQLWSGDDQEDTTSTLTRNSSQTSSFKRKIGLANPNRTKSPRRPFGCRAHMTLMRSEGAKPIQSGLDHLEIIDLQLKNEHSSFRAAVRCGTITGWGQGRYYLGLNLPIICQGMFTGHY